MLKFTSNNDKEKKEREASILTKMTLGRSFKEDHSIFKNIHSFLKPKKKQSFTEPQKEIEEAQDIDDTIDVFPLAPELKRTYNFYEEFQENILPITSNAISADFPSLSSPSRDRIGYQPNDVIMQDTSQIMSSVDHESYWKANNASFSAIQDAQVEEEVLLNTSLSLQIGRPRPLRRNSYNSVGGNSGGRTHRHNNLATLKRDRKQPARITRSGLRRINSTDVSQKEICTYAHQENNNNKSARKAFEPRLSESGIPFYHDENNNNDQFPRITAETLKRIVQEGIYKPHYSAYHIVDCRFEYEFKGGHVTNALNISSREDLEREFIHNERSVPTLLIFHCEFSSYRGPMMASHLRNCDRMVNYDNYPDLLYPDILVLEGGYKEFFDCYPSLCYPCKYVGMDSSENLLDRDYELERFRQDSKKMISRNSSLQKLTSVPSSSKSSAKKLSTKRDQSNGTHKLNCTASPSFKYEIPPKLSLSRYSNNSIFGSSDDNSSLSRLSITSSPNVSTSKILLMDGMDGASCYSSDEGDSTFTTPIGSIATPTEKKGTNQRNETENASLNPVRKLLFSNILKEEEGEASD